jgi:hypothetical protein
MHNRFLGRGFLSRIFAIAIFVFGFAPTFAQASDVDRGQVLRKWYDLTLSLIRHTPTYTPPVASRGLAYVAITAFEVTASGASDLNSLGGQLRDLKPVPQRDANTHYDDAIILNAALSAIVKDLFRNTGPSGQQAIKRLEEEFSAQASGANITDSVNYGREIADHIIAWSREDGGAKIENMGFPLQYDLKPGPAHWVPTNPLARQQQLPLLPQWANNRPFAMPDNATCPLPPPLDYSEDPASAFYKDAREVYDTGKSLTNEQKAIAFFWADDAMASPTPAGHWISILMQIADADHIPHEQLVEALARLSVAMADAFIGCWHEKYRHDLLRPITYIKRVIDPDWTPFILTPPFPEYPSGHSTLSGAAATVMTDVFGDNYKFSDRTRERDKAIPRSFQSFWAAAREAAQSRLYGGIHFRAAIERGLDQGQCIAAYALQLKTRK